MRLAAAMKSFSSLMFLTIMFISPAFAQEDSSFLKMKRKQLGESEPVAAKTETKAAATTGAKVTPTKKKAKQKRQRVETASSPKEPASATIPTTHEVTAPLTAGPVITTPPPTLVDEAAKGPAVTTKVSGFAWIELEKSSNFGYDKGTDETEAIPNFDKNAKGNEQELATFFSNVNVEISRENTKFVTIFEMGELYFGDAATGGGQGARSSSVVEVRNIYLNQTMGEHVNATGGIVTTMSDPRSFIFNDHVAAGQLNLKLGPTDTSLWYANAAKNREGEKEKERDYYWGLLNAYEMSSWLKLNTYAIYRNAINENYSWLGATLDLASTSSTPIQATYIHNWTKEEGQDGSDAYLADLKASYVINDRFDVSLEGLATSGAKQEVDADGAPVENAKRKSFNSPVANSYLLTIATSDGVDDAPGAPKQSIIADLNQTEGLRMGIFTANAKLPKDTAAFVRYGHITTSAPSLATDSTELGQEVDLGVTHNLDASTLLQFDYANFIPGDFYEEKDPAYLLTGRIKFTF